MEDVLAFVNDITIECLDTYEWQFLSSWQSVHYCCCGKI